MSLIKTDLLKAILSEFQSLSELHRQQWEKEATTKDEFLKAHFSQDQIDKIDQGTLRELIHILWSFNVWTNKDYVLEEMLRSGLPQIRSAFKQLLYSPDPLAKRFDHFKENVRMMGAASISEILLHHDHKQYALWNSRSRDALLYLGISDPRLPKHTSIKGIQYEAYCKLMQEVRSEVAKVDPEFDDLLKLDFLLYYISLEMVPEAAKPTVAPSPSEDFDHDTVVDQVIELGDALGFEVQKEFTAVQGCRIDAIWRSRVANLGTISYAFEVHRRGSRDSAILNLQRIRRDPTIQKVVLVSSKQELDQFRREIETLSEDFRNAVRYFDVRDLEAALNHAQSLKEILNALGLLIK